MEKQIKNRKIQQTGYSYWITLPPVWTESIGLLKGDFVAVKINDKGELVIKPVNGFCPKNPWV